MTRIIVKNLPNSVNPQKLKETFSLKGQITDVQLKYDKQGKFRHFGFIGFKTDEEAEAALKYFNNTYVGSCKIQVERCTTLGESVKHHNALKKIKNPNMEEKTDKNKPKKENKKEENHDPEFKEFLEVHSKKPSEKNVWSNDAVDGALIVPVSNNTIIKNGVDDQQEIVEQGSEDKVAHKKNLSDLDYLKTKMVSTPEEVKVPAKKSDKKKPEKEFFTLKARGFPCQSKKKDIRSFFSPLKPASIRLPPKVKGVAYVGFLTEKEFKKALDKHRSVYGGNRITVTKYERKNVEEESNPDSKKQAWTQQENDIKKEESIAESGRIFIRNLPYSVTEDELEALFKPYGPLAEIHVPIDKFSRKIKGFAFVTYVMPEHAVRAYSELDGTVFQGRMLHLIAGKSKQTDEAGTGEEGSSYKQKKLKQQKAQASSSHNWNTLFLGANAVATLMAERYGTTKQEVLLEEGGGRNNQSVAVRLALGETQLVAETKQFLVDNGIVLEAFQEAPKQRSKTIILVKNLEAQTIVDEIRELFTPFGELGRVLLPPHGVTAIVEFLEPTEAKAAFRKLAYSKFKHIPLYLEWAPVNVFRANPAKSSAVSIENGEKAQKPADINNKEEKGVGNHAPAKSDEAAEDTPEPDTTLFVKNINFATTDETLRIHFEQCGPVYSAIVAKKKDPKNPGQFLSMGYGFVQFWTKKSTVAALKDLQGSKLDDHIIELKRSNRAESKDDVIATARKISATKIKEPISSKILVRNVPFEATTKEVAELFKPFGELKAVRLPKKSVGSGSHRGFAFIDFITKQDAKRAFESLSASTHLYGRRLVLEWASEEDTIEDVRRRTTSHYADGPPAKRGKKAVGQLDNDSD